MNKRIIENGIEFAFKALEETKISNEGIINKGYRGQISTFGAAVTMGSLIHAIAYFSANGDSKVEREKLMKAILYIIKELKKKENQEIEAGNLFDYACKCNDDGNIIECKEEVINAAISLKLAMNLFVLEKDNN